jgi:hypothetical protein
MKCKLKYFIIFLLALLMVNIVNAEKITKTGTMAAKFLSIGVGSRANALGDAFVAIANDATAMYWNPSGISQLKQTELVANYTQWIADMYFSYIGLVIPMERYGVIGLNTTYLGMGEMEVTTEEYPEGNGEYFSAGSYAIGFSYARRLTDRFSIGGNLKYINEFISNCDANTIAIDVGTLFITPFRDIRFGVCMSNFGGKMQITGDDLLVQKDIDERIEGNNESVNAYLATDEFDLPLHLRVGLSGDFSISNFMDATWAIDAAHPNDNSEYINYGIELAFLNKMLIFRVGMKSVFMDNRDEKLSVGGGLNIPINNIRIKIDYAYQSYEHLEQIHKYTMRVVF